jgi:hypothetical protein
MAERTGIPPESSRDGAPACRCSPTVAGKGKGGMGDSPRAAIMAGIRGEMGGGMKGDLTAVKLRFNEGNGCGLMVEGGGVLH